MTDTLERNFPNPHTELEREIAALGPWFHNLHLPGGVRTAPQHPLGDFPAFKWEELAPHLPNDLSGWKVLDIGCNAGFYSFALARRGAEVTGIDLDPHYLKQARWAADKLDLTGRVRFEEMSLYDLARVDQVYDLVWFMGVFYHLRYPLLALDIIARRTRQLLVFQTLSQPGEESLDIPPDLSLDHREMMRNPGWPQMAFIEKRLSGDPTNWWAPNHSCIEAMLRSCGFGIESRPGHELYICQPGKAAGTGDEMRALIEPQYLSATGVTPAEGRRDQGSR